MKLLIGTIGGNEGDMDQIGELLKSAKTIAVVGFSNDRMRASFGVSSYMKSAGYRIIPVNPQIKDGLGEKAYASLADVPDKIDTVRQRTSAGSSFSQALVEEGFASALGVARKLAEEYHLPLVDLLLAPACHLGDGRRRRDAPSTRRRRDVRLVAGRIARGFRSRSGQRARNLQHAGQRR